MALTIKKNYLTKNRCYQNGATCSKIGIQIHTIGTGQNTAQSVADYWNQSAVSACVHYCVDAEMEGKVLQFLPEERRSWADAGYGNNNLITIEICESDSIRYTGGANYTVSNASRFKEDIMRGYQTAVELCAKICKERGWNPKKKLPSGLYLISSHDEGRRKGLSSAHVDPTHVWNRFGLSMDGFRDDVYKKINKKEGVCEVELPVLRRGDKNNYVRNVQRILRQKGYKKSNGELLTVDGTYGPNTVAAVKKFQTKAKLKKAEPGVMDAKTWDRLLRSY